MSEHNSSTLRNDNNPYADYGLLAFIGSMMDKFPSIKELTTATGVNTATLFTPQIISMLDGEIARNSGIIHDSYLMVDLINMYSLEAHGNIHLAFDAIAEGIIKTRAITNTEIVISEEALDHYTVIDADSFLSLIYSNKVLVAVYLYLLVSAVF